MRAPSFAASLFLALFASSAAMADPGVNFSWDACTSEGGVQSKTFACNTNSGSRAAWASFVPAADESTFVGIEAAVDVQADADSLPSWWQFYNAGSCRSSALSVNFLFGSDPNTNCFDPWGGQATGGIGSFTTYWTIPQVPGGNPFTARIRLVGAVPSTSPILLSAGTEYYAFKVVISNTHTVGTGACGGCTVPTCMTLYSITTVGSNGSRVTLTAPLSDNVVHWQSTGGSCPGAQVPPPPTWGQLRSILR